MQRNNVPTDAKSPKHVLRALQYKEQGLIRISIHRSSAYEDREMAAIYKSLGVINIESEQLNKDNLVLALARTNTPQQKEIGVQANDKDIDTTTNNIKLAFARNIIVPPMTENNTPYTTTLAKPDEVFFNEKAFKNYTTLQIPRSVAITLSFGSKFSVPIYYKEDDFEKLKGTAIAVNEIFAHPVDRATINNNIHDHINE